MKTEARARGDAPAGMFGSGRTEPPLVIDSYAWVDYFHGSGGGRLNRLLEEHHTYTPTFVLSEVGFALLREGQKYEAPLQFIQTHSRMVPLTPEIALMAVGIHSERRRKKRDWPMADSVVLATARHLKGRVVTGDPHFEDLGDEVVFLK